MNNRLWPIRFAVSWAARAFSPNCALFSWSWLTMTRAMLTPANRRAVTSGCAAVCRPDTSAPASPVRRDRTGVQWRYLPHDFPHWNTVYGYFAKWADEGVFAQFNGLLRQLPRKQGGMPSRRPV